MKTTAIIPLLFATLLAVNGCGVAGTSESENSSSEANKTSTAESAATVNTSDMFTDNDMEIGYDEETSAKITLSGDGASSDSSAVQISDSTITITDEGTYILSGTLDNGMIIVNAKDTDKVHLVLNGVQITSSTSAAIYVAQADKVFLTTASDSKNTLANGGKYVAIDDNNIDAVVFSKADLTFNGSGTLTIDAPAGHGVVSKDDLVLTSGAYNITAANHGLSGKDSIRVASGTYHITSGKDSMQAENEDDTERGFVYIADGSFTIAADDDGISASAYVQIADGDFSITAKDDAIHSDTDVTIQNGAFTISSCYEGIEGKTVTIDDGTFDITASDDGINAAGGADSSGFDGGHPEQGPNFASSDCSITINGGTFVIVSDGDCIDSNGALTINGGTLNLTCNGNGNTALDCDGTYTDNGGDITTNDGSENNPGQMGGHGRMDRPDGKGGPGKMGGPNGTDDPGKMDGKGAPDNRDDQNDSEAGTSL